MNKKLLLSFFVAGLIVAGLGCNKKTDPTPNTNDTTATVPDTASTTTPSTDDVTTVDAVVKGGATAPQNSGGTHVVPTQDYTSAIAQYGKSGFRFQFVNCISTPIKLTMKKGVKFMLDNRDNKAHAMAVGKTRYLLRPYDFAIVSIQKPGTYDITCDSFNRASVNVQE